MNEKLIVATYLQEDEKEWLKERAARDNRSMAAELRQILLEKMKEEKDQ